MDDKAKLSPAQQELYDWLCDYIRVNQHGPSIRQMMRAMGLKSPAPIQSRLDHLRKKGYVEWVDGLARTLRIVDDGSTVMVLVPRERVAEVRQLLKGAA